MTSSPSSFFDLYSDLEKCYIASDMRSLGFNEETIKRWLSRLKSYEDIQSLKISIDMFKQQEGKFADTHEDKDDLNDLYGEFRTE